MIDRGFKSAFLAVALCAVGVASAAAADIVKIYGAVGPEPAMREAAAEFSKRNAGTEVQIKAAPTREWLEQAKEDADLLFSGSASMMSDLVVAMDKRVAEGSITPLFFRPSVILVRPGNPKHIKGVRDLLHPDMSVLIVNGAGQAGLWEDVVGRLGDMQALRSFRGNIVAAARDGAEARSLWNDRLDIDAWLSWNIWGVADRAKVGIVPIEKDLRIFRPVEVALTRRAEQREAAVAFFAFLQSPDAKDVFEKWGWTSKAGS